MLIPWGQHFDLARCIEGIGEHDLGMATSTMAGALHLLQRDFLIESVRVDLVQNKRPVLSCTDFCTIGVTSLGENLVEPSGLELLTPYRPCIYINLQDIPPRLVKSHCTTVF